MVHCWRVDIAYGKEMTSKIYEIVEVQDGEYVLQRADGNDKPLVRITFSETASEFLSDARTGVVKTMIEAGLNEVEDLVDEEISHMNEASPSLMEETIH